MAVLRKNPWSFWTHSPQCANYLLYYRQDERSPTIAGILIHEQAHELLSIFNASQINTRFDRILYNYYENKEESWSQYFAQLQLRLPDGSIRNVLGYPIIKNHEVLALHESCKEYYQQLSIPKVVSLPSLTSMSSISGIFREFQQVQETVTSVQYSSSDTSLPLIPERPKKKFGARN